MLSNLLVNLFLYFSICTIRTRPMYRNKLDNLPAHRKSAHKRNAHPDALGVDTQSMRTKMHRKRKSQFGIL